MKTPTKIALIAGLALMPIAAVVIYGVSKGDGSADHDGKPVDGQYYEVDWTLLRELDVQTGSRTGKLAAVDGQFVKIPGFVVPLDDDDAGLSEFLLVPSPQACIHVPPPPPNQMVMVRMKAGTAPQRSWGPVWIKGKLHIATTESQYGKISYLLHGNGSEPYRMPDAGEPPPP